MFFNSLPKRLRSRLRPSTPRSPQGGFTLIELLVALIVGSIIVSVLLFLVVDLLKVSKREEVLTTTQQDMRRALAFMANDVGEADYVYADPEEVDRIAGQVDTDPSWPDENVVVPVLAFWRLDPLTQAELDALPDPPNTYNANDPDGCVGGYGTQKKRDECSTLKIRQSAYSLVIYLLVSNDGDKLWEGPARIVRYELPKYKDISNNLEKTPGYDDPSIDDPDIDDEPFAEWVVIGGPPEGNAQVLADHVDLTDASASWADCSDTNDYLRVPEKDNSADPLNSFYICARLGDDVDTVDGNEVRIGGLSQSLTINLTGNIESNPATSASSSASKLPALQSEVLVRGVIEKRVEDD